MERRSSMSLRIAWVLGISSCLFLLINAQRDNTGSIPNDTQKNPIVTPTQEITPTPVVISKR